MNPKVHKNILIIDVETTGLDPVKHSCIEIGAVRLDKDLNALNEWSSLLSPWEGSEFLKEALAVHKISVQEIMESRPLDEVIKEFDKWIRSEGPTPILSGWNVWFDVAFLRDLYKRANISWPFSHHYLDVQSLMFFFSGIQELPLNEAVQRWIGEKQTHRALDDAKHTAQILRLLATKHLHLSGSDCLST